MANQSLCLKWDDFQDQERASLQELRNDTDFTDVTLACEDQNIKAHKVILSACSPFFKKLLKAYPHPHPLIYMKGMRSSHLTVIIDFLYLGEANIFQEDLESFFALAEELQLKGLLRSSKEETPKYKMPYFNHKERKIDVNQKQSLSKKDMSDIKSVIQRKAFEGTALTYPEKFKPNVVIGPDTLARIESMIERGSEGYSCTNCGYTSKKTSHIREHVEKHIDGLEYPCILCNKTFGTSASCRNHICKRQG